MVFENLGEKLDGFVELLVLQGLGGLTADLFEIILNQKQQRDQDVHDSSPNARGESNP
jgi:hypothetical protein